MTTRTETAARRSADREPRRPARAVRSAARSRKAPGGSAPSTRSSSIAAPTIARPPTTSPAGSATCSLALTEFGWKPVEEGGKVIALVRPGRQGQPRAGRAARAFRRGARKSPPDLRRGRPPSRPGQGGRRQARPRLPRPRHVARQEPRRAAAHAQGPLRDHAPPHAAGRQPRPRHDASHLHHPGQSGLCLRSRHGAEVPGRPRPAAARHRPVRQLALHRGQAQRLPLLPKPHLVGHRSRTAPECCPSSSRTASATNAISTMRSMCRCTSSTATAAISTPPASRFRDFLKGELPVLPGEKPRLSDWTDHLSTAFPEVRLKSFLEMRGADGGRWSRICALPALWVGLLYDQGALDAAWDEVRHWSLDERQRLRDEVPKLGLAARTPAGETLRDLGRADPRHRRGRPQRPRPAQRRRRQRIRLPRSAARDRRPRHHAGRDAARTLSWRMGRRRRPHLRGDELLRPVMPE